MGRLASVVVVLTLALLSSARADQMIVRGKSIGPVVLGMSVQELYGALGNPIASDVKDQSTAYTFDGLQVGVKNDTQLVYRIFATSPKFKLVTGITVGSTALAVVAAYGEPYEQDKTPRGDTTFCYRDFELYLTDGVVAAIMITEGGCTTGFLYYLR